MAWGRWRQVTARRPPRPLLAAGTRRAVAVIIAVCVAVVTALAIRYAGHTQAGPFDASVDRWFQTQLGLTSPVLTALTWLGDPVPVTLIVALSALGCALARWWRGLALAVLAVPAASGLTEGILKPLIGRTIDGLLSLPSGHTTAVFSMATLGAILLAGPPAQAPAQFSAPAPGHRARRLLTLAAYVLATAVAVAMVAQGFHYFTDTIAGVGVGVGTVLVAAVLIDAVAGRLARRGPAEATMAACPAASPPSSSTPSTRN